MSKKIPKITKVEANLEEKYGHDDEDRSCIRFCCCLRNKRKYKTYGIDSNNNDPSDQIVGAAAVAGAVVGFTVTGRLLGGLVGGLGTGALATQNNKAGDVARASGEVVVAAGERIKHISKHVVEKTKEFEGKHKIGEKIGNSMTKGLQMVSNTLRPKDPLC